MEELSISQTKLSNLQLANAIFSELGIDEILDDEEKLYSDELYISIISYIVPENSFDIETGGTKDQMYENLNKLVEFLGSIVEIDLNHIDTKAIIYEKNSASAKHLLELVFELIVVLKKEQMNQEGEEEEVEENNENQDQNEEEQSERSRFVSTENNHKSQKREEISEDYLKNQDSEEVIMSNSQVEFHNQRLSSENKSEMNDESLRNMSIKNNSNYKNNNDNSSHNKSKRSVAASNEESGGYIYVDENNENSDTSLNKYNLKPNYTQADLSRYIYEQNLIQLFQQQHEDEKNDGNNSANYAEKDKSKSINISRISEVSHSKENSDPHANKNYSKGKRDENMKKSGSNTENPSKLLSSWKYGDQNNPEYELNKLGSKKSQKQTESVEDVENNSEYKDQSLHQNDLLNSKSRKNSNNSSQFYEKNRKSDKSQSISQKSQNPNIQIKKNIEETEENEMDDEDKGLKKIKSQKQLLDKETEKKNKKPSIKIKDEVKSSNVAPNNQKKIVKNNTSVNANKSKSYSKSISRQSNEKSKIEISMSSINSIYKQSEYGKGELKNQQESSSKFVEKIETDEIPLNNSGIKAKMIKDIKRIYGTKFDKLFLKEISTNKGLLDNILKTFKLAKDKMVKVGVDDKDTDDILTKECLEKIRKQYDYILKYYNEEQKKRNFFRQKTLMNITKNNDVLKKVQRIESDKIKEMIEKKKKAREIKNRDQQIKICKEVYAKTVELEKQKLIEDKQITDELRMQENEERRKAFNQIENYYKDKISMLREILQREKYEREIEYRAQIQYFSKLQRESKREQKEKINKMFNKLDEEDRNYEVKTANNGNIEELITTYYKYS